MDLIGDPRLRVLIEPYSILVLAFPAGTACPSSALRRLSAAESPPDLLSVTATKHELSILADSKAADRILLDSENGDGVLHARLIENRTRPASGELSRLQDRPIRRW